MFKETQTYSFTTTRKIARDQAPHWGKKEKNTGAREKKFGWRIFFLPLVDIFPISPPFFFCLFPAPQSLVPGYAQDDAIHNKVPSIGRQTKNAPITNTVKTTSSFRNAMVLLPFKWNRFDRTSVKNYLFSSYLKKDIGIFVVKILSPLGVKGLSTWSRRNSFTHGLQGSFIVL